MAALATRGSAQDVAMMPRDQVTVFELAPGRAYLLECELDRMNRRLAVKLDGVQIGQRRTGLVRWLEKEVTVAKFGRWLSD